MILAVCLVLIGSLGSVKGASKSVLSAVGSFMVCINLFYHASIGPLSESLDPPCEISEYLLILIGLSRCSVHRCRGDPCGSAAFQDGSDGSSVLPDQLRCHQPAFSKDG